MRILSLRELRIPVLMRMSMLSLVSALFVPTNNRINMLRQKMQPEPNLR